MTRLFVVGAPSGTGKTTLLKRLLVDSSGLCFSVSHTSRAPRPGEVDGRDYHFVDRGAFAGMAAAGEFLEWAEVYGNLYGTHRGEVDRARETGRDLLLDVDVQGARSVRAVRPDAVLILILPPSWGALAARLVARRTENEETIRRRLTEARAQVAGHELYDYVVVNDDLERAAHALSAIVLAERHRHAAQADAVRTLVVAAGSS